MWQKEYSSTSTLSWDSELTHCENSTYAGYSDWRLPNKNELASLINYETSYSPDMQTGDFWSSSTYVYDTSFAWVVQFDLGLSILDKIDFYTTINNSVRCVRNAE